jgi:hypothetical protein
MGNRNRKHKARAIKRSKTNAFGRRSAWLRGYLSKNHLALLSATLMCLGIAVAVYTLNLGPDIRLVRGAGSRTFFSAPVRDSSGGCFYYLSVQPRFRNESFKGGYVKEATFTPLTLDLEQKFEPVELDRSVFGSGEEREVEAKFKLSLTPASCEKVASRRDPFRFAIYFYDDTGKLINKDTAGDYFLFPSEIRFSEAASQVSRSGDPPPDNSGRL